MAHVRKLLTVVLALFVSASVWASRARPVSDLRFEGNVILSSGFVASDGKDFLFLSTADPLFSDYAYVFAQRVVGGIQIGPSLGIGAGRAAGIAWTGSDYLVSWSNPAGIWTARLSRQGALISGSTRLVMQHPGRFASNAQSALVVGRIDNSTILAQPLDLTGQPSGPAVTMDMPINRYFSGVEDLTVSASGTGYAIVSTGYTNTLLRRLRSDGTPLSASPVLLEGPYGTAAADYHSNHSVVGNDGTDLLILFAGEKFRTDSELKTVIIGPDGTVKRPVRTAFTIPGAGEQSLQPVSVVWTGSEYVIALFVSKDPSGNFATGDAGLLRISRSGDAVGDVAYTTSGARRKGPIGLGWNGNQFLVPWYDATTSGVFGSFCAAVPMATMIPSAPAALGRSLNTQSGLTIAASNGQYLAAWFETGSVTTLRASRLDAAGNFLDGEGIALATVPKYTTLSLAIDGSGTDWLVVWANGTVVGRRISRAGSLLDAQPFSITGGSDVAVRWNGSNYVVVAAAYDSLSSALVSRDGTVTSSRRLATGSHESLPSGGSTGTSYTSPSLVVVQGQTLAAYLSVVNDCFVGTPGGCNVQTAILGLRLDSSGNPIDQTSFSIAANYASKPTLATDGTHHLLTWSAYDPAVQTGSIFGTFLSAAEPQQTGMPFRIASKATLRAVALDGSDFLVAFQPDGSPDPVGTLRVTPAGTVKETVMLPLDDGEVAINPTIAASPGMSTLIGYVNRHPAYEGRSRAALLFSSELVPLSPGVPSPPSITGASSIDQNTIDVRWQPAAGAIGTSVELQLEDGAYRTIGVAGGGASSARFSLAGLQGSAVRLHAWNAAGLSEASASVPIALPRQHAVRR